jgi:hypothetical protein
MTILVALAGLMVPRVRGFFGAAQDSTSVSSLAEMDKLMEGYYTRFGKEPNNMEALINGTAGASTIDTNCNATNAPLNSVYCKLMYPGYFTSIPLTNAHFSSLTMAGITSLYYNNSNTDDATFASTFSASAPISLTTGAYVASVAIPSSWPLVATGKIEDYLADVFGTTANNFDGQNCYTYVAFGIGNQSQLTGTVMSTTPVHFNADGSSGPNIKYNRFVAIYQVDASQSKFDPVDTGLDPTVKTKGCSSGIESAKYIGSVIAGNVTEGRLMGLARTQGQTHRNINKGG